MKLSRGQKALIVLAALTIVACATILVKMPTPSGDRKSNAVTPYERG